MSKLLRSNIPFLQNLTTATPAQRKKIIENASAEEIKCLTEIAMNITHGHFPVSDQHFERLKKHKHTIRQLAKKSIPHKAKKIILNQKGGFLPVLIAPVLAALGSIAGRLISYHLGLT
jgi:hypothetical protein